VTSARLTIDLAALARNYAVLRAQAGGAETAAVVKADGYGLGAAEISNRLWEAGARAFFVARLSEGEALRTALRGRKAEIFVLDGAIEGSVDRLLDARLTPVLNQETELERWSAGGGKRAALHFDTGMNRAGLSDAAPEATSKLVKSLGLEPRLVMSHLGCASDPAHPRNAAQLKRFALVREAFPETPASLAASAGIYLPADYHFEMVRPGISLYGGGPREVPDDRFAQVAKLEAPVLQLRDLKPGDQVGYGSMFTASEPMRIAVVGAGYADGVQRRTHSSGFAVLAGQTAPYAVVTMDLIAIDVRGVEAPKVGDMVELLGPNVPVDAVAQFSKTVAHECLTRLSYRAERRYVS